jgi:hypothetical protein
MSCKSPIGFLLFFLAFACLTTRTVSAMSTSSNPGTIYCPELATRGLVSDREKWEQDFRAFLKEQGRTFIRVPLMGYREIDFYSLYKEVICWGGYEKAVHCLGTWAKIWKAQPFYDPNLTDGSFRLKKNYEKWLLAYERQRFDPKEHTEAMAAAALKNSATHTLPATKPNTKRQQQTKHSVTKNVTNSIFSSHSSTATTTSFTSSFLMTQRRKRLPHHSNHSDVVHLSDFENDGDDEFGQEVSDPLGRKESAKGRNYPFALPTLPHEVDSSLTIVNFGTIILKAPFVDSKHIWPIGYKAIRKYPSSKNPNELVAYTCEIIDLGDRPLFCVFSDEDVRRLFSGS